MNDAGEVLLTIYERVMEVLPQQEGAQASPIQRSFGLPVDEHVHCHSCGRVTQQCSYTQFYHNIQVRPGLVVEARFCWLEAGLLPRASCRWVGAAAGCLPVALQLTPQPPGSALVPQAASLQAARGLYPQADSMLMLMRLLEQQHMKTCDQVSGWTQGLLGRCSRSSGRSSASLQSRSSHP